MSISRITPLITGFALTLLLGCTPPAPTPPTPTPTPASTPSPDAIAVWDGGEIGLIDVEDVLRTLSMQERSQRETTIFDTYRELARELALLRIHWPATDDPGPRPRPGGGELRRARRDLVAVGESPARRRGGPDHSRHAAETSGGRGLRPRPR